MNFFGEMQGRHFCPSVEGTWHLLYDIFRTLTHPVAQELENFRPKTAGSRVNYL